MYLSNKEVLSTAQENLKLLKSHENSKIYKDLISGKYNIVFSFDKETGAILYEAVPNSPEVTISYMNFSLLPNGEIKLNPNSFYQSENIPLAYYIISTEANFTSQQFKEKYNSIYQMASSLCGLTRGEITKRKKARDAFIKMFKDTDKKSVKNTDYQLNQPLQEETPRVKLSIKKNTYPYSYSDQESSPYVFALRSFYKTYASNLPLEGFMKAYLYHKEFQLATKFEQIITPSLFNPNENALIQHIAWYLSSSSNLGNNFYELDNNGILNLADCVKGDSLVFENENYSLSLASPNADVKISSDGRIILFPIISKDNQIIIGDEKALVFDKRNMSAVLYKFTNETLSKLYRYFLTYGTQNYDLVKDLMSKEIVPVLGTSLIERDVDSETGELEPLPFTITTIVDLSDDQELTFNSQYMVNNEEISSEDAVKNPFYNALISDYKNKIEAVGGVEKGVGDAGKFLNSDLTELKKVSSVYLSDRVKRLKMIPTPKIQFNVSHEINWLSVSVRSDDLTEEEMEKIFKAYKAKRKYTILNDKMILIDSEKMAKIKALMESLRMKNDALLEQRVPFFDLIKLNQSKDLVDVRLDDFLENALVEISKFKETKVPLAMHFHDVLRDYQEDAVKWLYVLNKNHMCGILADDMGLGKTLEMIAFISTVQTPKPVLVVCPKSLVYNWAKEFQKWDSTVPVVTLDNSKDERKTLIAGIQNDKKIIYITSYDSLRNDLQQYKEKNFSIIVLDEAQYIKNQATQKSKAVKLLNSDSRFALTGTPIENSLGDLWSIFDFLMPGYLDSYDNFREDYELKIDGKIASEEKSTLTKKVLPFILRRTKEQVLTSLPPKTVEIIYVNMTDKQKDLYQAYLQRARETLKLGSKGKLQFLAALMRLRQICVDPSSFLANYHELSAKLSLSSKQIENSIESGHKVLVFSSFTSVLEHLRELLRRENIDVYYINGQTSAKDRLKMADEFNSPDGNKIMLVSLKAGGTGLNLIGADTVIHLDPWWNFAAEEQATDRAHRIGQTRPVNVYKLICHDTVEERVIDLQNAKKDLYDAIIQSGDNGLTKLSADDIKYILG